MNRAIYIFALALALISCSDKNRSNTNYIFLTDHYSAEVEDLIINTLSIQAYSPCPNLATSTYNSKIIRYDLKNDNESNVVKKSLMESIFSARLKPEKYSKKINRYAYPANLRRKQGDNINPKNLEYFLNYYNTSDTRVFGLNSIGVQYKNLSIRHNIQHFQNIFDLKDALSDYICNEINVKNAVILINLFTNTGIKDCLAQCQKLPEKLVCADDGKQYRNIKCMMCYSHLNEITCNQPVPIFKKEELTDKAFEVFYQFVEAQNLIANDKNAPIAEALIENTLRLFDGEDKKIEILNLGSKNSFLCPLVLMLLVITSPVQQLLIMPLKVKFLIDEHHHPGPS